MTTEEIRKGIEQYTDYPAALWVYLHENGLVIKVDREYPEDQLDVEYRYGEFTIPGYGREFCARDQEALDRAGYEAVEPLIGVN